MFNAQKRQLIELSTRHRIPTMYEHRDFVDGGGLLSYGPNLTDLRIGGRCSRSPRLGDVQRAEKAAHRALDTPPHSDHVRASGFRGRRRVAVLRPEFDRSPDRGPMLSFSSPRRCSTRRKGSSSSSRHATAFRPCTSIGISWTEAGCCPTARI